jgi:hypothetical protein
MEINQYDKNGVNCGPWEDYNGIRFKGCYRNGERYGLWLAYKLDGRQPWYKGEFKKDKQVGLWYNSIYND